ARCALTATKLRLPRASTTSRRSPRGAGSAIAHICRSPAVRPRGNRRRPPAQLSQALARDAPRHADRARQAAAASGMGSARPRRRDTAQGEARRSNLTARHLDLRVAVDELGAVPVFAPHVDAVEPVPIRLRGRLTDLAFDVQLDAEVRWLDVLGAQLATL